MFSYKSLAKIYSFKHSLSLVICYVFKGIVIEEAEEVGEKRKGKELQAGDLRNLLKRRGVSTQEGIKHLFNKGLREEVCLKIARFFYNNAIPFNVARSEEYSEMVDAIADYGKGFKPPSYHEIRVRLLKEEVKQKNVMLEAHKAEWKRVGCTIMTDGWIDRRRRTIINFLVSSPMGTVFLKSIDASHFSKT